MLANSWLPRLLLGLLLTLVGLVFGTMTAVRAHRHSQPPLAETVDDAARLAYIRGAREHVRLTDLIVQCDRRGLLRDRFWNDHLYARGVDRVEAPRWVVLIELDPAAPCDEDPDRTVGTLERADDRLTYEAEQLGLTSIIVLRPYRSELGALLTYAALLLLGALLTRSGLRRRASERELLRRITDESPPPADEPRTVDPYRQTAEGRLLPGPLRLDERWMREQRRRVLASGAGAAVVLVLTLGWFGAWAYGAVRTQAAWSRGTVAIDAHVGQAGGVHLAVVDHSEYVVVYTDAAGRRQHSAISRTAFGFPPAHWHDPIVRLAADDPEHVAVSWLIDEFSGELWFHLAVLGLIVPTSLALLRAPRRRRRELAAIRDAIHNSPEEVVLDVLSCHRHEIQGQHIHTSYSLQIPGGNLVYTVFAAGERPLFLELDESKLLGLRRAGDPSFAVILREDLVPLIADPHAGERVRRRWRRDKPA